MTTWVDILWPMLAATSLTLASIHGAAWRRSGSRPYLAFAFAAVSVAAMTLLELAMLRAPDAAALGALTRWMQVPVAALVISLVWFVHAFLGAGNLALGIGAAVLRVAVLPLGFATNVGIHPSAWIALLADAMLLSFLFVALYQGLRRGDRASQRQVLVVCGSWMLFVALAAASTFSAAFGEAGTSFPACAAFVLAIVVTSWQLGARRPHPDSRLAADASQATDRFRNLFENVPVGLLLVNAQGRIAIANTQAARIFGSERAAMEGCLMEDFIFGPLRRGPAGLPEVFDFAPSGTVVRRDGVGLRCDGVEVPVAICLKSIHFPDGACTLATVTDISALKRAESDAAQQRDELAHLARVTMIGELSGGLAHELNQPLMAILSNAQAAQRILQQLPTDIDELQDILSDIVDDDRRAGDVIRRMRVLLKKGHVEHVPLDVNALVVDVLRLVRSDFIHRGVEARMHLAPGLPAINGDPVQLQQVLVNLLFNACDAMEDMESRVVDVHTALSTQGAVRICVEDAGSGIPPAMLDRIFEPFETTKSQGMGLGLAVSRTIVGSHGGMIWAENLAPGARLCLEFGQAASAA